MRRLLLPGLFLCACTTGNVVGSDSVELAAVTVPADAGVEISKVELRIVEVRSDDGKSTHKLRTIAFDAAGDALATLTPGLRYACTVGDTVLAEGFTHWANGATDGRVRPELPLDDLDDYLRHAGVEPSACEFELQLRERGPVKPPPAVDVTRPLGKLCYRVVDDKRTLTDGACPDGLVPRKPSGERTVTARVAAARPFTLQPGNRPRVQFGVLFTLQRPLPEGAFSVAMQAVCDGKTANVGFGAQHFQDLAPGESLWHGRTLTSPDELIAEPKQCEITVRVSEGEATTEVARACWRDGAVKDGAC